MMVLALHSCWFPYAISMHAMNSDTISMHVDVTISMHAMNSDTAGLSPNLY